MKTKTRIQQYLDEENFTERSSEDIMEGLGESEIQHICDISSLDGTGDKTFYEKVCKKIKGIPLYELLTSRLLPQSVLA